MDAQLLTVKRRGYSTLYLYFIKYLISLGRETAGQRARGSKYGGIENREVFLYFKVHISPLGFLSNCEELKKLFIT